MELEDRKINVESVLSKLHEIREELAALNDIFSSREKSIAITKLDEAGMWLSREVSTIVGNILTDGR